MDKEKIKKQIESILFLSNKPISEKNIFALLKKHNEEKFDIDDVKKVLEELFLEYQKERRGIVLDKIDDSYQFTSNPESAPIAKSLVKEDLSGELTIPALEALTIIAYKGPIAKQTIDHIRGVNCSLILRNLLIRGLVSEATGKEKDVLYFDISFDFLRHLGLSRKEDLPDFERLNKLDVFEKLLGQK